MQPREEALHHAPGGNFNPAKTGDIKWIQQIWAGLRHEGGVCHQGRQRISDCLAKARRADTGLGTRDATPTGPEAHGGGNWVPRHESRVPLARPLQRYIGLRYVSPDWEVSLVRISALAAAAVLLFAAPDLAHAQQPGRRGQQHEQPAARPAEPAPRQTTERRTPPRRESPPPRATREEPRQATPDKPTEPRSTGEPELKRRKPD